MAIIYYPDYKEASERHLETCLKIREILETQYQSKIVLSTRESIEQNFLLSNLYYLSGYIIECIYNYAIFKNISYPNNIDVNDLKYNRSGPRHNAPCNVAFRHNEHTPNRAFIIAGARGHKLFGHMDFFQNSSYLPHAGASSIPLLDGHSLNRPCNLLFQSWDVYSRYKIDSSLSLNFTNTFDFFDVAIEVYKGVIKYL